MGKRLTQEEFIRRAKDVHGDKYDYSKVEYKSTSKKVLIVCPMHGDFWQTPQQHFKTCGCEKCSYDNRGASTTEAFIKRAKEIHGNKYDYSKVQYVKSTTKVCIVCPKHGEFWQTPSSHVNAKQGCQKCYDDRRRTRVLGWGINDAKHPVMHGTEKELAYKTWTSMIRRCYSPKYHKFKPTYIDCQVCSEWKYFSNFERWFYENYKDGYVLDKDIIKQGNKIYSPDTCCFVPPYINCLLAMNSKKRGKLKTGVYLKDNKYVAQCGIEKVQRRIGVFDNENDAHEAYKVAKYAEIKRVAKEALKNEEITKSVYDGLMNFKISEY